jgi:hypothetical protein
VNRRNNDQQNKTNRNGDTASALPFNAARVLSAELAQLQQIIPPNLIRILRPTDEDKCTVSISIPKTKTAQKGLLRRSSIGFFFFAQNRRSFVEMAPVSDHEEAIFVIIPSKYPIEPPTVLLQDTAIRAQVVAVAQALPRLPCLLSCYFTAVHAVEAAAAAAAAEAAAAASSSSSSSSSAAVTAAAADEALIQGAFVANIYNPVDVNLVRVVNASESLSDRILLQPQMFNVLSDDNNSLQQRTVSRAQAEANMRAYAIQKEEKCQHDHDVQLAVLRTRFDSTLVGGNGQTRRLHTLLSLPFFVLEKLALQRPTVLDLSHCLLKSLPLELPMLANLTKLVVDSQPGQSRGNQLTSLPESIGNLVNLKYLSVANNRLVTLPASICQLEQLETFWANNNNLIQLPAQIFLLRKLQRFIVCDNLLRSLPSEMHSMRALGTFVVANNPLRYPPNAHTMQARDMFEYMRLHPNEEESTMKADMSAAIDDTFADLHLDAPGRTVRVHQAMVWARATHARSDDAVPLWRNEPPLPPSGAPSGTGPLHVTTLSADDDLLHRFALFTYTDTMKDASDAPLTELLLRQGLPSAPRFGADENANAIADALGRLLASQRFTDLTIDVGSESALQNVSFAVAARRSADPPEGASFRVHRFVLAARSPYFRALLSSGMSEARAAKLAYPDVDSDAFRAFVHYLYTDKLDVNLVADCSVQTLILACRFGVERLSSLLQQLIFDNMEQDVAVSLFVLARSYNLPRFRAKLLAYVAAHRAKLERSADWNTLLTPEDLAELRTA